MTESNVQKMTTHAERRTRVDAISRRTGKPHFYVYPKVGIKGGRVTSKWLCAGRLEGRDWKFIAATWEFQKHLNEACGYE